MKKFVVLLVVVAMTCISSMAFAATEMTVSGQMDIRSRNFDTLSLDQNDDTKDQMDTQERVRLNVDAKVGDTKGKISIENDWDTWGRNETYQADASSGTFLRLREAWVNFNLPGVPVNVTAGHQLLSLGNGWFFRSMKYGSDAWVFANVTGNNTAAFVDVKFSEGQTWRADDKDAYVLLDMMKLGDGAMVGINITDLKQRITAAAPTTDASLQNIGLTYSGKVGPVALNAELDVQMGKETVGTTDMKFKGNQLVVQGNVPMDKVNINFTIARGSGEDATTTDIEEMKTALDADPHYTFMYEYKIAGPAGLHTGFANTTALNVGASMAAMKNLTVSADLWILQATEDVADKSTGAAAGATASDLGTELDLKANWAMAENLSWNWTIGYFAPGAGMGNDAATGIQGVLSYKF